MKILAIGCRFQNNPYIAGMQNNDLTYDYTNDGVVDPNDLKYFVKEIVGTSIGDSNMDGVFDSADLVLVFEAALYETGLPATWEQGDWNGDGMFDSADLVFAFEDGGYED